MPADPPPLTLPAAAQAPVAAGTNASALPPAVGGIEAPAGPPPEDVTKPHRLVELVDKHNKRRRRALAGEVRMKRPDVAEVRLTLERSETVIGRDPSCDIVLSESTVSRRHAAIKRTQAGFFELTDMRSRNGVLVEGERVTRMTLQDGDEFMIGDTKFAVVIGAKPDSAAT